MTKYIYEMLCKARNAIWSGNECPLCKADRLERQFRIDRGEDHIYMDICAYCPLRTVLTQTQMADSCSSYGKKLLERFERFFDNEDE